MGTFELRLSTARAVLNENLIFYVIRVNMSHKQIYYSDKYYDEHYEYRHVMLPKDIAKMVPKTHLMSESEWRAIGVQQSQGWIHYERHEPEPHILLFRRPTTNNNASGAAATAGMTGI